MKSRIKLFALVVFAFFVTVCYAQQAATPGADLSGSQESVQAQSFPYLAEITGDDVLIRTGAGRSFYDCGKFKRVTKYRSSAASLPGLKSFRRPVVSPGYQCSM